ncbi:aldose 1-epimerase family protein [Clostridium sp. Sa3CUN1]|uniref:Aldose 1-epimerase family protein n=1 Tax=Clostridium gallinarum TaxID=2762246 RepID=A0ABR8Q0E9_9CLOT|nr:aldose 1-epimerase family protein [Clostridium gallinarum]MBD7913898.1 aldose 1-epimerase family protein [Clostridium gallinarum]
MNYILENENIKISTSTFGGELNNLITKNDNIEFLWSGDETYWKYHSPILFPIVGKVLNNKYKAENNEYELPQHGLARTREFNVIEKDNNHITFELLWSEDTLKIYPYKFSLKLTYTLLENGVSVNYNVKNLDNKEIYFSIGGHPAFMCPLLDGEKFEDYYLQFNEKERADIMELDSNTGYFTGETKNFFNNENKINLNLDLFKDDAIVFSDLRSNSITLKNYKNNKELTMDYTGFPYLAIWTKPTGAPFVCIEPWYGHSDYKNFNGDLKDKEGIEKLSINEEFTANYKLFIK